MADGLTFLGDSLVSFSPLWLSKVLLGAALQDPTDEGARPLPCALALSFRTLTLHLAFATHKVTWVIIKVIIVKKYEQNNENYVVKNIAVN